MNQVIGYRVSYTVDGTEYTYDYYNFAAAQAPNIPTNTPVSITAICNSPYEVAQWSSGNAHAGNVTLAGSEGHDGTEAYGNTATLTVNSAGDARILLYVDSLKTVEVPKDEDLTDPETGLLKDNAVKIDCTNEDAQHADAVYGLLEGTYTIGDLEGNSADGYTCDVTITDPQAYVNEYNDTLDGHKLDPADQGAQTITLKWVNGEWTVGEGEAPVTYTVVCETQGEDVPDMPTPDEVERLLSNGAVRIDCVNTEESHDDAVYRPIDGSYTIGAVEGDAQTGYTSDITFEPGAYVNEYSRAKGVAHKLDPAEQGAQSIEFTWNADEQAWEVTGTCPVSYTVICDGTTGPEDPETPDKPTTDEVDELLAAGAVKIDCVNEKASHADAVYAPILGSYIIGDVTGDADTGYTSDITFTPAAYVYEYSQNLDVLHTLSPESQADQVITFTWNADDQAWKSQVNHQLLIQ